MFVTVPDHGFPDHVDKLSFVVPNIKTTRALHSLGSLGRNLEFSSVIRDQEVGNQGDHRQHRTRNEYFFHCPSMP